MAKEGKNDVILAAVLKLLVFAFEVVSIHLDNLFGVGVVVLGSEALAEHGVVEVEIEPGLRLVLVDGFEVLGLLKTCEPGGDDEL